MTREAQNLSNDFHVGPHGTRVPDWRRVNHFAGWRFPALALRRDESGDAGGIRLIA
jgi:hypothetical protein